MKGFLLILSLFLSCLFSGSGMRHDNAGVKAPQTFIESADSDTAEYEAESKDEAILPVRTATYSGDGNNFSPSVRSTNSGRRVQTSSKSAFRILKAGKVFDRNNFHSFRATILQFQSGIRSNSRYIHSICHLLI